MLGTSLEDFEASLKDQEENIAEEAEASEDADENVKDEL